MPCRNTWEHMNKARVAEAARGTIQMKCVSVSRTSTEAELAIFPTLQSGWSDSANSKLHSVSHGKWPIYVRALDSPSTQTVRVQQCGTGSSGTRERCVSKPTRTTNNLQQVQCGAFGRANFLL